MKILDRFLRHDYICPGPFRSPHPRLRGDRYEYPFLTFLRYLAEIGVVSVETITPEPETDLLLRPFEEWLRYHRGIGDNQSGTTSVGSQRWFRLLVQIHARMTRQESVKRC